MFHQRLIPCLIFNHIQFFAEICSNHFLCHARLEKYVSNYIDHMEIEKTIYPDVCIHLTVTFLKIFLSKENTRMSLYSNVKLDVRYAREWHRQSVGSIIT